MGYSFWLIAKVLLYIPSHRQDNTYHGLCYTSRGALAGTRNSSLGPPHEGSIRQPIAPWANALTTELYLAPKKEHLHDKTEGKEGNILFTVTWHWIYGKVQLNDRGISLPPLHGLLFTTSCKRSYIHNLTDRTVHTTAFVTLVIRNWRKWEKDILVEPTY